MKDIVQKEIKRMPIKEFRKKGYLQEVNRRILHPLGLALEVSQQENGEEIISGVWDYREDEEGIHYALNDIGYTNVERLNNFKDKFNFIENEIKSRKLKRAKNLGYFIEPIKEKV